MMNKHTTTMISLVSLALATLACTGETEVTTSPEEGHEAPAEAPERGAKAGHGGGEKAEDGVIDGQVARGKFVRLEQGDLLHLVIDVDGTETSFECLDESCQVAEGFSPGQQVVVRYAVELQEIPDLGQMELEVVKSVKAK